jgi:hypothetical protein
MSTVEMQNQGIIQQDKSLPPADQLPPVEQGPKVPPPNFNPNDEKMVLLATSQTPAQETTPPPLPQPVPIPDELSNFMESLPDPREKDDGKAPKGIWISQSPKVVVTIYVYKNVTSGEMTHVTMEPVSEERKKILGVVEYPITAEFRIPDHRQLDNYRERHARWSDEAQALLPNRYVIRRVLIKNHLDSIDLMDPRTGEPVGLKHDKSKKLTPESEAILDGLHPTIIDLMMLKYERVANLVY